jgi:hypothetical protein
VKITTAEDSATVKCSSRNRPLRKRKPLTEPLPGSSCRCLSFISVTRSGWEYFYSPWTGRQILSQVLPRFHPEYPFTPRSREESGVKGFSPSSKSSRPCHAGFELMTVRSCSPTLCLNQAGKGLKSLSLWVSLDRGFILLLLQRSLLPGGIILQGVLLDPPRFYERFCVPLRLGASSGYGLVTPSSTREEESITSYSCISLGWVFCLPLA